MSSSRKRAAGSGYELVDSDVSCMMTRFEVRSLWHLFALYRSFRRVRGQTAEIAGLLNASFVIENRHTCYTLSFWREESAILEFNAAVREHVDAANGCFRLLARGPEGPQLWSAILRLWAVSPRNLRWGALDLGKVNYVSAAHADASWRATDCMEGSEVP